MFLSSYALWFFILVCTIAFSNGVDIQEGDRCTIQNERTQGTCSLIFNCSWALTRIKKRQHVDLCSYVGKNPVVCCPENEKLDSSRPLLGSLGQSNVSPNPPIRKGSVSASEWSEQRCEQYYPAPEGVFIAGVGGERSLAQEFPHMAVLGYGNANEKEWRCGGSLISHQHVLTAAHCIDSRDLGEVKYVRVGDLDINNDTDLAEPQDFNVKLAILHPDFDHLTLKNDIAILVLEARVRVTDYVKPGCLFPGGVIEDHEDITATGWGITQFAGDPSSHLIKVQLQVVNNTDCRRQYRSAGARGDIDEQIQVCAGSAYEDKIIDTCKGDSGGPLQMTRYRRKKHYLIFGVTSFGKACGVTRSAGVYTRVSNYLPWIQSIVENNT